MGYICTRCGGTNVVCEAIVNPNTGKIIDYLKAWEKLMSECPSMTSKEFWNNEWEEFDKEEISTHWYFIVGKPESIIDELINLEIGDTNVFYPHIKENRPWDIEEMDWYDLREHANTMSDFIQKLYNYI